MLYQYTATTLEGELKNGSIEASSVDVAISALQARDLVITDIKSAKQEGSMWGILSSFKFFNKVKHKDVVILSRQLATLFEAKITVMDSLRLLAGQVTNVRLKESLTEIIENIKGGSSLSLAMSKHPDIFFVVMILMLTFVIPKLTSILTEVNQKIPIYTKIIINISDFFRNFGVFLLGGAVAGGVFLWRYAKTEKGSTAMSRFQTSFPFVGALYSKFYLSRMTDNMETLLSSGVPAVRTLEITADVVGNKIYKNILLTSANEVKGGSSISEALSKYPEVPLMVVQMIRTGEE